MLNALRRQNVKQHPIDFRLCHCAFVLIFPTLDLLNYTPLDDVRIVAGDIAVDQPASSDQANLSKAERQQWPLLHRINPAFLEKAVDGFRFRQLTLQLAKVEVRALEDVHGFFRRWDVINLRRERVDGGD